MTGVELFEVFRSSHFGAAAKPPHHKPSLAFARVLWASSVPSGICEQVGARTSMVRHRGPKQTKRTTTINYNSKHMIKQDEKSEQENGTTQVSAHRTSPASIIYIYIYIYIYRSVYLSIDLSIRAGRHRPQDAGAGARGRDEGRGRASVSRSCLCLRYFEDTVYPFCESDTLFFECLFVMFLVV